MFWIALKLRTQKMVLTIKVKKLVTIKFKRVIKSGNIGGKYKHSNLPCGGIFLGFRSPSLITTHVHLLHENAQKMILTRLFPLRSAHR